MSVASDLSARLAHDAEAVCRHYLSAGRRHGNYWIAGDTGNNPGRSLYVQLTGARAGRWADAATGQYGDLLDLMRETCGLVDFQDVADEARRFLRTPRPDPVVHQEASVTMNGSATERARRLFAIAQPLQETLADHYLRKRGILRAARHASLRFHPHCFYRDLKTGQTRRHPALIAAVTDAAGVITGVHRTYLSSGLGLAGVGKAKLEDPRRALGRLLGNAVRFGVPTKGSSAETFASIEVLIAGEGIETMLSLSHLMPAIPVVAALTANHLAAFNPPAECHRLYIAADADAAGRHAIEGLSRRALSIGILPLVLSPELGDFNEDLRRLGPDRLTANLRLQLAPEDALAFLPPQ